MPKKSFSLAGHKALAILVGSIVFQLLFSPFEKSSFGLLSIPIFGTVGFFLTLLTGNLVNFLAFKLPEDSRKKYIQTAATISIISAFASIFRASFIDRFLLSALSSFWLLISFYLFVIPNDKFGAFSEVLAIPVRMISPIFTAGTKLLDIISKFSLEGSRTSKHISKLIIGLIITVPAAGFLLILLSSADPIFGHYIERIFTSDFSISEIAAQALWRIFFSICVLVFLGVLVLIKNLQTLFPQRVP